MTSYNDEQRLRLETLQNDISVLRQQQQKQNLPPLESSSSPQGVFGGPVTPSNLLSLDVESGPPSLSDKDKTNAR
jgi:hypothetical protein